MRSGLVGLLAAAVVAGASATLLALLLRPGGPLAGDAGAGFGAEVSTAAPLPAPPASLAPAPAADPLASSAGQAPPGTGPVPLTPLAGEAAAGPEGSRATGAGELRCRVLSARTGKPLGHATLSLVASAPAAPAAAAPDTPPPAPDRPVPNLPGAAAPAPLTSEPSPDTGHLALTGIPPGTYTCTIARPGCTPDVREQVAVGTAVGIDLGDVSLAPTPALTGTVRAGDAPAGGATVAVVEEIAFTIGPDMDIFKALEQLVRDERAFATTTTDAQGSYTVFWDEVAPGAVVVRAHHTGRAIEFASVTLDPAGGPAHRDLTLGAPASLAGRVLDAAGAACPGCRVVLMPEPDPRQFMQAGKIVFYRAQVATDVDGRFCVDTVRAGRYMVWAGGGRYPTSMQQGVAVPGEDLEIRLAPALVLVGRVTDARTGTPIAGARIGAGGQGGLAMGVTDADGRYRLEGLSGEQLQVWVRAPGYAQVERHAPGGEGEVTYDLQLTGGLAVAGRVVRAGGRQPVAGARVLAMPSGGNMGMGGIPSAVTDGGGRFTLTGLALDEPTRAVPGLRPRLLIVARAEGLIQPQPHELALVAGEQPGELELVLEAATIVEGRVLDPDGAPVAGARITAQQLEAADASGRGIELDWMLTFFDAGSAITTDAAGRFRMPAVKPGARARVEARHDRFPTARSAEFAARPGATVTGVAIQFAVGARIAVRAVDDTGAPVEGQDLRLRRAPPGREAAGDPAAAAAEMDPAELMFGGAVRSARTDAQGRATFEGVPTGRFHVATDGPLVLLQPVEVEIVEAGAGREVELRLTRGLTIRGVVRDALGASVEGAWVNAQAEGDGMDPFRGSAQSDARGEFVIQGVAPGAYQLSAVHPERGMAHGVAATAGDQAVTLVLAPMPGGK